MSITKKIKNLQPYCLRIGNTSAILKQCILFGSLFPIQKEGLIISSTIPGISYDELLLEMFLQKTVICHTVIEDNSGYDFIGEMQAKGLMPGIVIQTKECNGNTAGHTFLFGRDFKKLSNNTINQWNCDRTFMINILTHLVILVPPNTQLSIYLYVESKQKLEHGHDIYKIISSEAFIKSLSKE